MLIKNYIKNILTCMVSLHTRITQGYTGYPKAHNLEDKLNLFVLNSLIKDRYGYDYPIYNHILMKDKQLIRVEFGNMSMRLDASKSHCLDIPLDEINVKIIENAYNHVYDSVMREETLHYEKQLQCLYEVLCKYDFDNKDLQKIIHKMRKLNCYESRRFTPILDDLCKIVDSVDSLNMIIEKLTRYVDSYETLMQNDGFTLDTRNTLDNTFKKNVIDSIVTINDINSNFPENVLNKQGQIVFKYRKDENARKQIVDFINNYELSVGGFNKCRYSFDKLILKKIENSIVSDTCNMVSPTISTNITPYYTKVLNTDYRNEVLGYYSNCNGVYYTTSTGYDSRPFEYISIDPIIDFENAVSLSDGFTRVLRNELDNRIRILTEERQENDE